MDESQVIAMKSFFSGIHPVDDELLEEYFQHWSPYSAPKRTIMTAPGETERYIYYVVEGIQKSYYQADEKQHIIAFSYAPSFSGVPESFFTQTPSRYFLETITDSQLLRLSHAKHQEFMSTYREVETLFRMATEGFLNGVIQRQTRADGI